MESREKADPLHNKKETRQPHTRTPKRKDAPVPDNKVVSLDERAKDEEKPFLEQLLQEGARKLLQAAIENQVIDYIQFHKDRRDENGQRLVVRNGHLPEREVVSGVGPIRVRQPRVRHRDKGRFSSAILPKYMRRSPSVDALIPALPERDLDRRFRRSVDRDFGPRSQWAFSHQHRQTQKQLGSRLQGMESA